MKRGGSIAAVLAFGAAIGGYALLLPESISARHLPITTTIVFNREIAQIFQKKCFQCHTDGNVGMALTTYAEARPWAVAIKAQVLDRRMPPWSAAAGYGHFANDMSLTTREISLILAWTDGGAPSGVLLVDEDKQPVFVPSLTSWEQGEPDEILKVAEQTKVAPESPLRVERFEIASGLKQPRWLRAWQLNPADRKMVRYAAAYETRSGRWLGTWTPATQVSAQPAGYGVQLPANDKLTIEMGYRSNQPDVAGSGAADVGLYFLDKAPLQSSATIELTPPAATIEAGKKAARVRGEVTLKAAVNVTALWPRLGDGARSLEITALLPDGAVTPLLWLNDYRAEWPSAYILKEPIALPARTRVVMTSYYDNETTAALAETPAVHITAAPPSRPIASPAP